MSNQQQRIGFPAKIGLYDPANEKDSCGVGFVAHIKGQRSHQIVARRRSGARQYGSPRRLRLRSEHRRRSRHSDGAAARILGKGCRTNCKPTCLRRVDSVPGFVFFRRMPTNATRCKAVRGRSSRARSAAWSVGERYPTKRRCGGHRSRGAAGRAPHGAVDHRRGCDSHGKRCKATTSNGNCI